MEQSMRRSEAIQHILSNQPLEELVFVAADRRRGTGGKLITLKKWMRLTADLPEAKRPGFYKKEFLPKADKANHINKTFTVFNPAHRSLHPISVHFRLLQFLNGKRVLNG